jgi:hypothetical protein
VGGDDVTKKQARLLVDLTAPFGQADATVARYAARIARAVGDVARTAAPHEAGPMVRSIYSTAGDLLDCDLYHAFSPEDVTLLGDAMREDDPRRGLWRAMAAILRRHHHGQEARRLSLLEAAR